jgi:hypothetical protein
MPKPQNRYSQLIEVVFHQNYRPEDVRVPFARAAIENAARDLGISLPKNLSDVLYSFRYRVPLPDSIVQTAPAGKEWIIRPAGRSKYEFALVSSATIIPNHLLAETKVLDATPGVIEKYALNDEQTLLARIRYNRLVDLFTGLVCYSLQSHLRTTAPGIGQVEVDEIYIGVDRRGVHYVLPVEAKGNRDKLGIVQIEQDYAVCKSKFPALISRPLAAQAIAKDVIAMFEFEETEQSMAIASEKHYHFVSQHDLSDEELASTTTALYKITLLADNGGNTNPLEGR